MISFPDAPTLDQIVSSGGANWRWDGVKWTVSPNAPKYIIACFVPGVLTGSQTLLMHRFSRGVTIPAGFAPYLGYTSEARGNVAATGAMAVTVMRALNSTPTGFAPVGTINIAAGAVVGTFTAASDVVFATGDTLALVAPGTADATFGGFTATLVGFES